MVGMQAQHVVCMRFLCTGFPEGESSSLHGEDVGPVWHALWRGGGGGGWCGEAPGRQTLQAQQGSHEHARLHLCCYAFPLILKYCEHSQDASRTQPMRSGQHLQHLAGSVAYLQRPVGLLQQVFSNAAAERPRQPAVRGRRAWARQQHCQHLLLQRRAPVGGACYHIELDDPCKTIHKVWYAPLGMCLTLPYLPLHCIMRKGLHASPPPSEAYAYTAAARACITFGLVHTAPYSQTLSALESSAGGRPHPRGERLLRLRQSCDARLRLGERGSSCRCRLACGHAPAQRRQHDLHPTQRSNWQSAALLTSSFAQQPPSEVTMYIEVQRITLNAFHLAV